MTCLIIPGYATQFGIGPAGGPADTKLDFVNCTFGADENLIDANAMRGTRSHNLTRVRIGLRAVGGTITMYPTAGELASLLPWILGANASGTTYALTSSLQERYVSIDRADSGVFNYDLCKVNRATFRGQSGQPLTLELDVAGIDEAIASAGTFPSLSTDTTRPVFVFHDAAISINSTAYSLKNFELTIDNKLDLNRYLNSQTRTCLNTMDREVNFNTEVPLGEGYALYSLAGTNGFAFTATFSYGNCSLVFTMAKAYWMKKALSIPGREELFYNLQGRALATAAENELVCTLDSTV